jgi:arsenite methyltransferase
MPPKTPEEIRGTVRASYAAVAKTNSGCCSPAPAASSCCGSAPVGMSSKLGYTADERNAVPEGSDMGLGCGNPTAIASLKPGETVLDLGSGGGFDCFLAAPRVGPEGRVIGVDMTPEMVEKARANVKKAGTSNVEFRLGEIEHLPVADGSVDVIISNCVINLAPDKRAVFRDAFRVLKAGGRLAISDIVATAPIPDDVAWDPNMISGCMGGAASVEDIVAWLGEVGFGDIRLDVSEQSRAYIADWAPGTGIEDIVASATIEAVKP